MTTNAHAADRGCGTEKQTTRVYLEGEAGLARAYRSVEIEDSGWVACRPSTDPDQDVDRYPPTRVLRVADHDDATDRPSPGEASAPIS